MLRDEIKKATKTYYANYSKEDLCEEEKNIQNDLMKLGYSIVGDSPALCKSDDLRYASYFIRRDMSADEGVRIRIYENDTIKICSESHLSPRYEFNFNFDFLFLIFKIIAVYFRQKEINFDKEKEKKLDEISEEFYYLGWEDLTSFDSGYSLSSLSNSQITLRVDCIKKTFSSQVGLTFEVAKECGELIKFWEEYVNEDSKNK